MEEVFGICKSIDDEKMIIVDHKGDDIEMIHSPVFGENREKILAAFKVLVGQRITYTYGPNKLFVKRIPDEEAGMIVTEFPSGKKRTFTSLCMEHKDQRQ